MKLIEYLQSSAATAEFVVGIRDFLASGRPNDRVEFSPGSPPVKIERTLTQLFKSFPSVPIERVKISGRSGCEYFRGELTVIAADEEQTVTFVWDCRWKADQLGWIDYFGLPDQIRAARELGYDCFREWDVRSSEAPATV